MLSLLDLLPLILLGAFLFAIPVVIAIIFRRVVPTNEVHIVQSSKNTTSYGKESGNGNTYYEWPSWLPIMGVTKISLPVSVFDLDLDSYEAYDRGRLPFVVDVKAFFRVADSTIAAQRVSSFQELLGQLQAIVQGAVRTILASNEIEDIMQGRSTFGAQFTKEVDEQLSNWGVCTVKNIELMDIRDHAGSLVIKNIMEKKKSHIEMESRTEVAKNQKAAKIAEIDAAQAVALQEQVSAQAVGLRKNEAEREVEIARETKLQAVTEQARLTKEKEMAVTKVTEVRKAEIDSEVAIVKANQDRQMAIVVADGQLEARRKDSEALRVYGEAKAQAEKAMQLAPVEAQIVLAKEIGENEPYQRYLVTLRQVEKDQAVGIEQAKALQHGEIKIIVNSGSPTSGVERVMDIFSSKGGTEVGAMLEGLAQTPVGKKVVSALSNGGGSH